MSAATATVTAPVRPRSAGTVHLSFPRLVRSEWIKFWTVRSTLWVLPITVLSMVGISFLVAYFSSNLLDGDEAATVDGVTWLVQGVGFAQLAIVVIAALTITGEYSTGMIRTTLTTEPRRLPALWAKLTVIVPVTFLVTTVGALLSWAVTAPVVPDGYSVDLGDGEQLRAFVGVPLYMSGIALLAFAVGALLRHSAAALATVLGLLLVIETVFSAIPATFFREVSPFLPGTAGSRILYNQATLDMMSEDSTGTVLGPWAGYGVLIAWGLVALAAAAVLLRRRDA
ncbi:ABC transporter permease [Actinomycetota bacterium]|nr:ABC transporter permease [Actinomycetota bacterium]